MFQSLYHPVTQIDVCVVVCLCVFLFVCLQTCEVYNNYIVQLNSCQTLRLCKFVFFFLFWNFFHCFIIVLSCCSTAPAARWRCTSHYHCDLYPYYTNLSVVSGLASMLLGESQTGKHFHFSLTVFCLPSPSPVIPPFASSPPHFPSFPTSFSSAFLVSAMKQRVQFCYAVFRGARAIYLRAWYGGWAPATTAVLRYCEHRKHVWCQLLSTNPRVCHKKQRLWFFIISFQNDGQFL